jgi:S-adenosylmethionine hydrolase
MDNPSAIITLTTDFGLRDPYVGQLKGALLKGCPACILIDLTHAVPPWDVMTAAFTIRTSYACFPAGAIHLIVVDPGVGTLRPILVAAGDGHFFVAPDNGILSLLAVDRKIETIHRVERPDFFPATVSPTFHGRDVMAPVAAALARGGNPAEFGPSVALQNIRMVQVPPVVAEAGCLRGQVQRIDHFGNVRTTIRAGRFGFDGASFVCLDIKGRRISRLTATYDEVDAGSLLVLVDSDGYFEIAANRANAAEIIDCAPGDGVIVHLAGKASP